jgi:hypothetical protein
MQDPTKQVFTYILLLHMPVHKPLQHPGITTLCTRLNCVPSHPAPVVTGLDSTTRPALHFDFLHPPSNLHKIISCSCNVLNFRASLPDDSPEQRQRACWIRGCSYCISTSEPGIAPSFVSGGFWRAFSSISLCQFLTSEPVLSIVT